MMTVGPFLANFSGRDSPPRIAMSSSLTILTTCCAGLSAPLTSAPRARSRMLPVNVRTTGTATFHGAHYDVDGATLSPLPLQDGGIPIWVAGSGEKVTLKIAARYAQYTNFSGEPEEFARKSAILAEHCATVGRDFDEITRSANFNVVVAETEAEIPALLDRYEAHYAKTVPAKAAGVREEFRTGPLVGTPEQLVEKLQSFAAAGLGYTICYFPLVAYDGSALELFEREVLPALRA